MSAFHLLTGYLHLENMEVVEMWGFGLTLSLSASQACGLRRSVRQSSTEYYAEKPNLADSGLDFFESIIDADGDFLRNPILARGGYISSQRRRVG